LALATLGILAGIIAVLCSPAYLVPVLRGSIRPHPVSWGIWATLGIIGFVSTTVEGGGPATIVLGVTAALQVVVFVLAVTRSGVSVRLAELWPLVPAVIGMIAWLTARDPLAAVIGVIVSDACGLWPTLVKTWRDPNSEPATQWLIGGCAYLLGLLSAVDHGLGAVLYLAYLTLGDLSVAVVAVARRAQGVRALVVRGSHV
jgi:hypothetical protein